MLKDWRNDKVSKTGALPVAVANNTLLKEIARLAPVDVESLKEVPGIRRWQVVADHGEELLAIVESVRDQKAEDAPSASPRRRPPPPPSLQEDD